MVSRPLLLTTAAFALLTLPLAFVLNIWQDEAYSLHTTSRDVAYALHEAITFEAQAPLYFLLLDLWRELNPSAFFARCLSIVCASASICVVWVLARRWLPGVPASLPTVAFAINPFVVWSALEIRLYALALLLSGLLTLTFCEGFLGRRRSLVLRVGHVLVAVAALYTQYYLGTILVGNVLVLIQQRAWKRLRSYCFCLLGIAIAALPLATILPLQLAAFRGYPVSFNPLRAAGIVAENVEFIVPRGWISSWTQEWQLNAAYVAVALTLGVLVSRREHDRYASQIFGAMAVAIAVCFFLAITVLHQQLVVTRQAVALLIPMLFTVIALLGRITPQDRGLWLTEAVYVVAAGASILEAYLPPVKGGDWAHVAAYVDVRIAPSDTIAVFNPEVALPFEFYNTAKNLLVSIPRPVDFDTAFDQRRFAIHNGQELRRAFERAMPARGHIWLISSDQSPKAAVFAGRGLLEEFVKANFIVVRVERFVGSSVRELQPSATRSRRPSGV
jgi:hypothetical protein